MFGKKDNKIKSENGEIFDPEATVRVDLNALKEKEAKEAEAASDKADKKEEQPSAVEPAKAEENRQAVELEAAKKEAEKRKNDYLYLAAEFENYKNRVKRDIEHMRKFGHEYLLKELLILRDDVDKALESVAKNQEASADTANACVLAIMEGLKLIDKKFDGFLEKHQVRRIESLRKNFDPNYFDALSTVEDDTVPENTVVQEITAGYMFHERLLRPAKVVVSKKKESK